MNNQKYIHEKRKICVNLKGNHNRKYSKHKPMCIEDYDKLPIRSSIGYVADTYNRNKTVLDFWYICNKYLKSKIGENWNDVYTDMIKKTKPKYRYLLDYYISYGNPHKNITYIDEIPYITKYLYRRSRTPTNYGECVEKIYIDVDGILTYHETEEDMLGVAKYKLRQKKLKRILEGIEW